jgi:diguanylate cyclase (GGDEF)-like protein/PAS domain S-box-containing protein
MTEILLRSPAAACAPEPAPPDVNRGVPMESGQRWRHLVDLAADMAFETDAKGRFVFVQPETALGWPAGSLIGQPSDLLIGDDGTGAIFNPFRPAAELRRRRVWLRRFDGKLAMMTISASPLLDRAGQIAGARGIGVDLADGDSQTLQIAGRLRRGEVLDHILFRVSQETSADCMMDAALWALIHALGAEGSAIVGAAAEGAQSQVLHECGPGAFAILATASQLLALPADIGHHANSPDGRFVLAAGCQTRFGINTGLAVWRNANGRPWDQEDTLLAGSVVSIIRMVLEYEAVQQEMMHQARTDPLTGLLNRRAFQEEIRRHIARLDREADTGTLMYVDMDGFKAVNDRLGHAMGDRVLMHLADMLRKLVRPSDLIARLGGDEFAIWLSGADHMTAAERADQLCRNAKVELTALLPEAVPHLGVSIGIARRRPGSQEQIEDLTRRADMAMYEVKRGGRGHWRVSLLDGDS